MKNRPIFIIGAGRSGTNILRDTLCRIKGFETWPCDEINYIWKHGNRSMPHDRFTEDNLNSNVKKFIVNQFEKFEAESGAEYVVEKTCANSLRVPFINGIFPEAKYIFIARDGRDAAISAMKRWTAPLDIKYILKKARYIPWSDILFYGTKYMMNRLSKLFSNEKRLASWGPIYPGMPKDLLAQPVIEICLRQWKECVSTAYSDLSKLPDGQVFLLKYEDFVKDPFGMMQKVLDFLEVSIPRHEIEQATETVTDKSVGNFKKEIQLIERFLPIIDSAMENVYKKL